MAIRNVLSIELHPLGSIIMDYRDSMKHSNVASIVSRLLFLASPGSVGPPPQALHADTLRIVAWFLPGPRLRADMTVTQVRDVNNCVMLHFVQRFSCLVLWFESPETMKWCFLGLVVPLQWGAADALGVSDCNCVFWLHLLGFVFCTARQRRLITWPAYN